MLITPDLSEATENTNEPIPGGIYNVRIVDVEEKTSKKGAKYLTWKLQIFGATGDFARFNNWPVFYSTMLSGSGASMLKTLYKAATHTDIPTPFDTDVLLGKEVTITLMPGKSPTGETSKWPDVKGVKALSH